MFHRKDIFCIFKLPISFNQCLFRFNQKVEGNLKTSAQPGGFQQRGADARHCPDAGTYPNLLVVGDYLFDSTLNGVLDSADYAAGWITTMAEAKE